MVKKILKRLSNIYEKDYKKLMIISLTILILAFIQIGYQFYSTGTFVNRGISLKGGMSVTLVDANYDARELQSQLSQIFFESDIEVFSMSSFGESRGLVINADIENPELESKLIEESKRITNSQEVNIKRIGPSLAEGFFTEILVTLLIAFLFMSVVVFSYFKSVVPSTAVILSAVTDIFVTLAIINLLGVKLSSAGISAFLMMLGYSVDTDILLATRMLKTKGNGTVIQKVYDAMKTGLTMTFSTIVAVTVGLIFSQSSTLREIMLILLIGLIADLMSTWIQNAGMLRYYATEKLKMK